LAGYEGIVGKLLACIVEDEEGIATVSEAAMQAAGFETEVIRDGDTALARLGEVAPALVLLDLNLPGVSGLDILNKIKTDPRLKETKVIIVTGDPVGAEPVNELADLVVIKPFSFDQLHDFAIRMTSTPGAAE
jgi:DNA-binding response OmpR family regulator